MGNSKTVILKKWSRSPTRGNRLGRVQERFQLKAHSALRVIVVHDGLTICKTDIIVEALRKASKSPSFTRKPSYGGFVGNLWMKSRCYHETFARVFCMQSRTRRLFEHGYLELPANSPRTKFYSLGFHPTFQSFIS